MVCGLASPTIEVCLRLRYSAEQWGSGEAECCELDGHGVGGRRRIGTVEANNLSTGSPGVERNDASYRVLRRRMMVSSPEPRDAGASKAESSILNWNTLPVTLNGATTVGLSPPARGRVIV